MIDFNSLPRTSERRLGLHVTPAAERAIRAGHPWLFEGAIRKQSHEGAPGDLAVIFDGKRRFLAIGLYDPASPLRVKLLQHRQQASIDHAFFESRLQAAAGLRRPLAESGHTDAYRIVHGENDGLPGLVVDRYAGTLVLKLYSAAWLPHLRDVVPALSNVQPHDRLVLRLSRGVQAVAGTHGLHDGQIAYGAALDGPVQFRENGLHFAADPVHGHKTGFFCDQRDNRVRVRDYVRERAAGGRILDLFAYNGGFSVYAASGGAGSVTSVDVSGPALDSARANMARNQENPAVAAAQHHTLVADVFTVLDRFAQGDDMGTGDRRFDVVVVDPPAFAKSADEVDGALHAYGRLARSALRVLEPGGLLVMASCSSRVTTEAFFASVHRAAAEEGRPLREIDRTGHALDHPVTFPEGAYLKCLFAHG